MTAAGKNFLLTKGLVNKYRGRGCARTFGNAIVRKHMTHLAHSCLAPNSELKW